MFKKSIASILTLTLVFLSITGAYATSENLEVVDNNAEGKLINSISEIDTLANQALSSNIKNDIMDEIKKEGYIVVKTHFNPIGVKSDIGIVRLKEIINSLV